MYNGMQNANMAQKSKIQQILEHNAAVESFKQSLNKLLESYIIKGNVFGLYRGTTVEHSTGYFVIECETDNLQDAIREMSTLDKCIRIVENTMFQVGIVNSYINECANNCKVIDIETQTEIER